MLYLTFASHPDDEFDLLNGEHDSQKDLISRAKRWSTIRENQFGVESLYTGKFTKNARLELTHFLMMLRDLLDAFQHQGTNPDAEVGSDHVHQTETGDHFETVDVELGK